MCLYLPRDMGDASADAATAQVEKPADSAGETVLLVEDEEAVRGIIRDVLDEAGYLVLTTEDGPSGLRLLQSTARIDLLITDVGLHGGMNGRQVADAGRALRPALKVLFVTGYADAFLAGKGLLGSNMEVITKPFELVALERKVRDMLDT